MGKRIRRELVKSPAKSALLGLACLVALWYWVPILYGWLSGAPKTPPDIRAVKPAVDGAADAGLVAGTKKLASTICDWQTLAKWMNDDPATRPAMLPESERDPFARPRTSIAERSMGQVQGEDDDKPAVPNDEPDISTLKLVLGGTIIGKRFRLATINGSPYQQGDVVRIPVGTDSAATGGGAAKTIEFKLAEVQPSHVVLARDGKEYRLQLEVTGLAFGDRIVRQVAAERADAPARNE